MFSLEKIYMSKTDASLGPLVGILRFDAPSSSTRTLSATQAYDTSRSQIVLGSFTGKLTDKSVVVKADIPEAGETWGGSITINNFGDKFPDDLGLKIDTGMMAGMKTVILNAGRYFATKKQSGKAAISCPTDPSCQTAGITFSGTALGPGGSSSNSKATNANTTYYGAITVALGEYKKWQGNYAVLKINTVTEKAVLRIYAD